ncbi:MAG: hypothetical protein ABI324_28030 [Ktedonobacteraceae bacterium]
MNEKVNVNERVTIKNTTIPQTTLYLLLPIECVGILVFLFYVAFHFHDFINQSTAIFSWLLWFFALTCYVILAILAVKVLRSLFEAFIYLFHGLAEGYHTIVKARQGRARVELLEANDGYVVYREHKKIVVREVARLPVGRATRVVEADHPLALPPGNALPTNVRYEDIRSQVPKGHILVGIGRLGIETKDRAVGALVWIVGLSGTGKTNTAVLRVEERRSAGHKFLGYDPHWFKPDSLTNALKAYEHDFILPMARNASEALRVLNTFLGEFLARKSGSIPHPWTKITLVVDEVNAAMDPTDEEEEQIAKLLKSIARICGQEARNFNMGGIFISQQATGLAWLRKVALMVIVHQLLMQSEKELACNGDKAAAKDMETWPVGRTYVFGVGFTDGPRTVQQPSFSGRSSGQWGNVPAIEATLEDDDEVEFHDMPTTPLASTLPEASKVLPMRRPYREVAQEVGGSEPETENEIDAETLKKAMRYIGKRVKNGEDPNAIRRSLGITGGRALQEFNAALEMIDDERGVQ